MVKTCPNCQGYGTVEDPRADVSYGDEPEQTFWPAVTCFRCDGTGVIDESTEL